MSLIELKQYLRIDDNESDALLEQLQIAAEEYLKNAGVAKDYTKMLYSLAVKIIVTCWFENRDSQEKQDLTALSLQSIIVQLRN